MEKETTCSVCGDTFTVSFPKYISEDEDPSVIHGVELRLTLGNGRVLINVGACKACIGLLIQRFSVEGEGMQAFLQFLGTPVEEAPEELEAPPEDPALPPAQKEEIFDEEMLAEMGKGPQPCLEAGDILTETGLKALEEEDGRAGDWKVDEVQEGAILTEEMLLRMEEQDG